MSDESRRLVSWASILNRPYCWKYGHDYPTPYVLGGCKRCGQTHGLGHFAVMAVVFAVPLMALYLKLRKLKRRVVDG
ncbi:MAG: hypothetical protein ABEI52_01775 [Halobacteriaceae archaeon]